MKSSPSGLYLKFLFPFSILSLLFRLFYFWAIEITHSSLDKLFCCFFCHVFPIFSFARSTHSPSPPSIWQTHSLKPTLDIMSLGFLLCVSASWVSCINSVIACFILFGKYFYEWFLPSWGFLRSEVWAFILFLKLFKTKV